MIGVGEGEALQSALSHSEGAEKCRISARWQHFKALSCTERQEVNRLIYYRNILDL